MVFMKDSTSITNDLVMRPIGRNKDPALVVVDESSKSSLYKMVRNMMSKWDIIWLEMKKPCEKIC